ncbi:hypothetical protein ACLOAV_005511 [Pseudogymnoascus australis]
MQGLKGTNSRRLSIPDVDLRHKWIILTGGNSGIGLEAALQFVRWGANIILGCRKPPPHEMHPDVAVQNLKAAALAAGYQDTIIEWWECDMASLKGVEAFGKRWFEKDRPLDILANNAGMSGVLGKVQYTCDGFEIVHQVNFLSHVLLTLMLLPSLARSSQPRIVCTTSCMQYFGVFNLDNANSGKGSYPNNKLYFQTWLTELQFRMAKHNEYKHITIKGVHPGYVKTNIWVTPSRESPTSWDKRTLGFLLKYIGIDAQQGSLAITYAATAMESGGQNGLLGSTDQVCGAEGRYANRIWDEKPMPQTMHPDCRREVWDFVSEELKLGEKQLLNGLCV